MPEKQQKLKKATGSLHPIPVKPKIFHQLGMDLIGPLPQSSTGNQYIVTVTDYFTKWAEANALPDKTAAGIAKFLFTVRIASIHDFNANNVRIL